MTPAELAERKRVNSLVEEKLAESIVEVTAPERGALWLDEHVPGWYEKIDLDNFDIRLGEACVLGQVFADEGRKNSESGYDYGIYHYEDDGLHSERLGFNIEWTPYEPVQDREEKWDELQDAWVKIISERQFA